MKTVSDNQKKEHKDFGSNRIGLSLLMARACTEYLVTASCSHLQAQNCRGGEVFPCTLWLLSCSFLSLHCLMKEKIS